MIELNLGHSYVVETLFPKMDFLKVFFFYYYYSHPILPVILIFFFFQDWAGYFSLLHDNDEDGLSEDDKICVARLFVLSVKMSCGEKVDFPQDRDPSKVVEISGDLFKLLDMYQTEPKVLAELCSLPRYVPGDSLAKVRPHEFTPHPPFLFFGFFVHSPSPLVDQGDCYTSHPGHGEGHRRCAPCQCCSIFGLSLFRVEFQNGKRCL